MSHEHKVGFIVGLITVIITLILIALLDARSETTGPPVPVLQHSVYDKRLDRLDRQGVEAAYRARVGLLFQNWMTDTNQESQYRAQRGHRNARDIYIKVMTGLDARDPEGALDEKPR
jgi:hypothetical protein